MNKINFRTTVISMMILAVMLSSCEAIAGIFKAGVWVGIIIVVAIVILIFWLISKGGKK